MVSGILSRPYYCGRIVFGKRGKKYRSTKNEDDLIITKGAHEPIIREEIFDKTQKKREIIKKEFERNEDRNEDVSVLSGLVKCPICNGGMIGRTDHKRNKNHGGYYKADRYYICRGHLKNNGRTCHYNRHITQHKLDDAVFETLTQLKLQDEFINQIKGNLGRDDEYNETLKKYNKIVKKQDKIRKKIDKIGVDMDDLDIMSDTYDSDYDKLSKKTEKLYDEYDLITSEQVQLEEELLRKRDKVEDSNAIYAFIDSFDKIFETMTAEEKREQCRRFIERIDIFTDKRSDGRILKSITFRFPIRSEEETLSLTLDCAKTDITSAEAKPTYPMIKKYVEENFNLKVSSLYIAEIKEKYGYKKRKNYNISKKENAYVPKCPRAKEEAIVSAFKHFKMLPEDAIIIE